jgi:hypothetical protein
LTQTATIHRPTSDEYDDYGNPVVTFEADEATVPCRIQVNASSEDIDERDTVSESAIGFFDPDVQLDAYVRIEVDGLTYEVDGAPIMRLGARGPHHWEATLRRVVA